MGETQLRQGEAKEAALVFGGISQSVPDSNLLGLVALRAGESWYQASSCPEAVAWLTKAVSLNDKDAGASQAWLRLADCHLRNGQQAEAREALKKLWIKFPQTKEAKEAEALLATNIGGEAWTPQPDDLFARAQVFLGQALHAEAIDELKRFLADEQSAARRAEHAGAAAIQYWHAADSASGAGIERGTLCPAPDGHVQPASDRIPDN